jgi:hypothetical protein
MKRSKAVSKRDDTFVVDQGAETPDYIKQGVARGTENVTTEDLVIPRLELVQALSPCLDENDAAYIEGAKVGLMFNSVTRELYGDSVPFIPVLFKSQYLLWRDRNKGGGFAGAINDMEDADDRPNWEALRTGQHFGLIVKNVKGDMEEAVLSMAKTKLKVSRNFNSLIRLNGGDSFARTYIVSSVQEANTKGDKYQNFSIKNYGWAPQAVYLAAEEMYNAVTSGNRVIVADTSADDEVITQEEDTEY